MSDSGFLAGLMGRITSPSDAGRGRTGCDRASVTIESIGDGRMGFASRMSLRRHLRVCGGCRSYAERMRAVVRSLEEMPRLSAPPGFTEAVLERLSGEALSPAEEYAGPRGWRGPLWVVGAAALGVTVAVALAIARRLSGRSAPGAGGGDLGEEDLKALGAATA